MIKKFKDLNNHVHEIEAGFEHLLPAGAVEITEQEAIDLLTPLKSQEEIDADKDAQVEAELGTNTVRVILQKIVPMIQDGSINAKTPDDVLTEIKSYRRSEL